MVNGVLAFLFKIRDRIIYFQVLGSKITKKERKDMITKIFQDPDITGLILSCYAYHTPKSFLFFF